MFFLSNHSFFRIFLPIYVVVLSLLLLIGIFFSSCATNLVDLPTPTPTPTRTPIETRVTTPTPTVLLHPLSSLLSFETGMATPTWSPTGYTTDGSTFNTVRTQTHARWVTLPILLQQATATANTVEVSSAHSASAASLFAGIMQAHQEGLRVFIVPLLTIQAVGGGTIHPTNEDAWFASYWHALHPFVQAAEAAEADQFAVGSDLSWLQQYGKTDDWNVLIAEVYALFRGRITYDTSWEMLPLSTPSWFQNEHLYAIGVNEYQPLIETFTYIPPAQVTARWRAIILPTLDHFAQRLGKPILLSSLGYRNSRDAFYRTADTTTIARLAPEEQDAAYRAALTSIKGDQHILGVFAWGWSNVGLFTVAGMPAMKTIASAYALL